MARMLTEHHAETSALRRYELLSENTRDIVLFIAPGGAIVEANRAAVETYGYSRQELLRMNVLDLRAPETLDTAKQQLEQAFKTGITIETVHRRKDGSTFPVEVSSTPSQIGGLLLHLVRDITQRKLFEQTQNLLREVDHSILSRKPVNVTLTLLCQRLAEMFGCALVWVAVKNPDGSVSPAAWAGSAVNFLEGLTFRWDQSAEGVCPTGMAIRTGTPQVMSVSEAPPSPWKTAALRHGFRTVCSIPLPESAGPLGALSLYSVDEAAFTREKVDLLMAFAAQVAVSMVFARDQEEIRLRTAALEAAANGIVITDRNGIIRWVNPAFTRLTGFTAVEAVGKTPRLLKSGVHSQQFYKVMWETILAGHIWTGEVYNRRKDGTIYPEEMTITPIRDPQGEITHFVAVKQDISERKRREEQVRYLSLHDPVTELPNRRSMEENLDRVVKDAQELRPGVLMVFDVDDFTRINAILGHHAADALLGRLAKVLRNVLRPRALVARWGDDEFAALLEDSTLEEAVMMADEVIRTVNRTIGPVAGEQVSVSVSITLVDGTASAEEVVAAAEQALADAKAQGKGGSRMVIARPGQNPLRCAMNDVAWFSTVEEAMREGRLELLLQPVVSLSSGQVDHYDTVLYWRKEDGELAPTHVALRGTEGARLLPDLDRWAVRQGVDLLRKMPDLKLFIHLSEPSLQDQSLRETVAAWVAEVPSISGRIGFEIDEVAALQDLEATEAWIRRLMPLGCRFALDDFGVGPASLTHLKLLPVEMLKLSPSVVVNLHTSPTDQAILRALVDLAHALGMTLTAKEVEHDRVAAVLREIGVDWGQGALWGRPSGELLGQCSIS